MTQRRVDDGTEEHPVETGFRGVDVCEVRGLEARICEVCVAQVGSDDVEVRHVGPDCVDVAEICAIQSRLPIRVRADTSIGEVGVA